MKKVFFLFFVITSTILSQEIISWQNYTNMQNVNDCEISGQTLWAATDGGLYAYFDQDSSYLKFTKSEGLSSHTITSVSIDEQGKIWIGTSDGYVNVYDPATTEMNTLYDISKTNEGNKRINDIEISSDTAFVSTEFGLILFNTEDLSVFDSILKFGDFNSRTQVKNILHGKTIYVVNQTGISKNKDGFDNLQAPEAWENIEIPGVSVINRLSIFNGILYAATSNGIYQYENESWSNAFLEGENVVDLAKRDNELYCTTAIYKNDKWDSSSLYKILPDTEIILKESNILYSNIKFLTNNNIVLTTSSGIKIISLNKIEVINPNAPGTNAIISLSVDNEGNLWSATGKDDQGIGVLKFDGETWQTIDKINESKFTSNDFHITSSSQSSVYFSTWGFGFIKYNEGSYEEFNAENTGMIGIPNANNFLVVNDIKEDNDGNTWITNYWSADREPISVLTNDGQFYHYKFTSPLSAQEVNVLNLVIDQYNTKWISGDLSGDVPTEGLYYFNENGTFDDTSNDLWGRLTTSNGLRNRDVKALAIDQFGELIIGTSVGVDVISDPSNVNSISSNQYYSLSQQTINCIAIDPINQKWFGTEKGVFLTSADGSSLIANYTKDNSPLPSNNINSIAIDKSSGTVYVGTNFGITAIKTLFIEPNETFSDIYVYPNPMVLSSSSNNLIIDGLIEDSQIRIFDISGNLISEFSSIGGKTTTWNCRNLDGRLVASGIYIVVAFDSEVNEIGHAKIAVLRK